MRKVLIALLLTLAVVPSARAQQITAFRLGFEVMQGMNILAVCIQTMSNGHAIISELREKKLTDSRSRGRLDGLYAMLGVGQTSVRRHATIIEGAAAELKKSGSINQIEFDQSMKVVEELRKSGADLEEIERLVKPLLPK